jgi:hypothetical protein
LRLTCLRTAVCVAVTLAISPGSIEATPLANAAAITLPLKGDDEDIRPNETDVNPSSARSKTARHRNFSKAELCTAAASVAAANKLPTSFFAKLIHQESGFKPDVVSPAGAQGIAQFMPRVAASYGLTNPFEPIAALKASGKLLADLVLQFGNLGLAAAAYNAGPKRVLDWMAKRGKLPAETRQYVHSITGRPAEHWARQTENDTDVILALPPTCSISTDQPNEPTKPAAKVDQIAASPKHQALSSQRFAGRGDTTSIQSGRPRVRRSMPKPSQFATGRPVSRLAMAQPIIMHDEKRSARYSRVEATRMLLHSSRPSEGTKKPTIMVEEKGSRQGSESSSRRQVKAAFHNPAPKRSSKLMRVAAAH